MIQPTCLNITIQVCGNRCITPSARISTAASIHACSVPGVNRVSAGGVGLALGLVTWSGIVVTFSEVVRRGCWTSRESSQTQIRKFRMIYQINPIRPHPVRFAHIQSITSGSSYFRWVRSTQALNLVRGSDYSTSYIIVKKSSNQRSPRSTPTQHSDPPGSAPACASQSAGVPSATQVASLSSSVSGSKSVVWHMLTVLLLSGRSPTTVVRVGPEVTNSYCEFQTGSCYCQAPATLRLEGYAPEHLIAAFGASLEKTISNDDNFLNPQWTG